MFRQSGVLPSRCIRYYQVSIGFCFEGEKIRRFAENDLEDSLFVMAGHSYELEGLNHWEYMEELAQYIAGFGFENLTTMEFVNRCYPQNYRR